MTAKELTEEIKKLNKKFDECNMTIYKVENAILDIKKKLKNIDREIEMLRRWRG